MADIEKVIEAFDEAKELVWTDDDEYTVGYNNGLEAGKNIAIALLKEHKPIEPDSEHHSFICPMCKTVLKREQKYCHECGQAVKWNENWSQAAETD